MGDIATVHTGDLGTSSIIKEDLVGAIGFATLNTRINNNKFLCHYFNSKVFKKFVISVKTGDGRDNLNLKDFVKANIPIPCLEE